MITTNLDTLPKSAEPGIPGYGTNDFSSLWEPAQERVRGFLRGSVFCEEDRKDLLQDVAQKALLIFHSFSPRKNSFTAWTLGIARNEYLHYLRSRKRAFVLFDSELADQAGALSMYRDEAESHVDQKTLEREIDRLSAGRRDLLRMKYSENLTCLQIAQRLGLSEDAVKMRLSRIRALLRRRLLPFSCCGK
jgi:RNA polymerase sigma-70 factor (ECF subfamily)